MKAIKARHNKPDFTPGEEVLGKRIQNQEWQRERNESSGGDWNSFDTGIDVNAGFMGEKEMNPREGIGTRDYG